MATTNVTVTSAWTKVAADTPTTVLIQPVSENVVWEIAAVATDTAPTVKGHVVKGHDQTMTRGLIGSGFLYARTKDIASAEFIVSSST